VNTLIVAATELEIRPLLAVLEKLANAPDVLITGIGTPFVMYHLSKKLQEKKYDLVLNVGIGGAFNDELRIGDLLNVVQDEFADLGIETHTGLQTIFEAGFTNSNAFPFNNGKLIPESGESHFAELKKVKGISVNTAHTKKENCQLFKDKFQADIESMEGAAVFYVCMNESIPCLQLRTVSNYVRERDKAQWDIAKAVKVLNDYLIKYFEKR